MRSGIGSPLVALVLAFSLGVILAQAGACAGATPQSVAAAADTSSTATAWAPSADTLALLRTLIGRRPIRVWSAAEGYEIHHARIDSTGVNFGAGGSRGLPVPSGGDAPRLSSPIAWSRIDRLEAVHSRVRWGAAVGTAVGLLAMTYVLAGTDYYEDEFMIFIEVPGALVGPMLLGTLVGSIASGRTLVWRRPTASSSEVP
jgi:hypothetical protein